MFMMALFSSYQNARIYIKDASNVMLSLNKSNAKVRAEARSPFQNIFYIIKLSIIRVNINHQNRKENFMQHKTIATE